MLAVSEMLVETEWLAARLDQPGLRIVDAGHPEAYGRAHVPGAVGHLTDNVNVKTATGELFVMGPEGFAETMGRMGIGDDTTVVVYDANMSLSASRVWWALTYYGHKDVRVLNGGWHKWLLEDRPTSIDALRPEQAMFTPRVNDDVHTSCELLLSDVGREGVAILDVRNRSEYIGENTRGNQRRGHVPGAVHLEWTDFIVDDARRVFKPLAELEALLQSRGVTRDKRVHVY